MPRALCALAMTEGFAWVRCAAGHMGPALQGIFVGQGPCALPGVQHKTDGRTGASAPTDALLVVRRGGALLPTVVPTD